MQLRHAITCERNSFVEVVVKRLIPYSVLEEFSGSGDSTLSWGCGNLAWMIMMQMAMIESGYSIVLPWRRVFLRLT